MLLRGNRLGGFKLGGSNWGGSSWGGGLKLWGGGSSWGGFKLGRGGETQPGAGNSNWGGRKIPVCPPPPLYATQMTSHHQYLFLRHRSGGRPHPFHWEHLFHLRLQTRQTRLTRIGHHQEAGGNAGERERERERGRAYCKCYKCLNVSIYVRVSKYPPFVIFLLMQSKYKTSNTQT